MNRHGHHPGFSRSSPWFHGMFLLLLLGIPNSLWAQSSQLFDVTLRIDYSGAERMLDFFDRRTFNPDEVAEARGNRIAAATSLLLARTQRSAGDFTHQLELVRDDYTTSGDIYGLRDAQSHTGQIRKLLAELRKRQLERRVIATIQAFFPSDARVSGVLPVYVVAMGNEKAAAFVRRVVWKDNTPVFAGENEGDPVIVLNVARMIPAGNDVNTQFIGLLGTLAHECFHAVFGLFQQDSEMWRAYHQRRDPIWNLAELVQNEGIAYYLSMQLQIGGQTPAQTWFATTDQAVKNLDDASKELLSPYIQPQQARALILNANMSGSFEGNYGATAGLRIAYEIDTRLGRPALAETINGGVRSFFGKYDTLCQQNPMLPRLEVDVLKTLEQ